MDYPTLEPLNTDAISLATTINQGTSTELLPAETAITALAQIATVSHDCDQLGRPFTSFKAPTKKT